MTPLEPFRLGPVLVERPWGGRRLTDYGKDLPSEAIIGESWELCDLPQEVAPHVEDPSSTVLDGPYAGHKLRTVVAQAGQALLGSVSPTAEGRFPLLFKLLDAREHLSVQVHPPEGYVASHPEARLKTESWYIIEADPGAVLYLDVVAGTSMEDIEAALGGPDIVALLDRRAAVAGAFHHLPAGLIHALGAGTLAAEVQTPSDTTFRLYDWAREYGRAPRPLHAAESLASIVIAPPAAFSLEASPAPGVRELVSTDHYRLREHHVPSGSSPLARTPGPTVVCVTRGSLALGALELSMGTTAIVPASASVRAFEGDGAVVMEVSV